MEEGSNLMEALTNDGILFLLLSCQGLLGRGRGRLLGCHGLKDSSEEDEDEEVVMMTLRIVMMVSLCAPPLSS